VADFPSESFGVADIEGINDDVLKAQQAMDEVHEANSFGPSLGLNFDTQNFGKQHPKDDFGQTRNIQFEVEK